MEDIYDDLDNYNEVNCIQELRTENSELKVKLEEHATALEKLQKDYDTLSSEFKKLENNYSSLLKTARSEIERKTQRISQLNQEKDMMVLHSLQKGIPIRRHFNKTYQPPNQNRMTTEKSAASHKVKEDFKPKIDAKNERYERPPPPPILGPSNKDDSHKAKEVRTQHKTEHAEPPVSVASSIKNRRKSTPAVAFPHDKFSSEEEFDQNNPAKSNRDIPPSAKFERRNTTRFDRQSNRSETSSVEDSNTNYRESSRNYHEYSKDYKESKPTRPYEKSSHRGKDKHESSSRHRKHYSPERLPKKPQRDYKDDYPSKEHGRYRTLESPPHESSSRHHQRSDDPRSNFDRHAQDYEKRKPSYEERKLSYEERFALKHRLSTDYDEPHSKRQRRESFGTPDTHFKEDRHTKSHHVHDLRETLRTPRFSPDEYENLRATCQSPDYEHSDSAVIKPKEIMATAATPLDDPRVTSKKYVVKKENGKEVLSTAVGRNVDITPVDKIVWKMKPIDVPVALVRRPSQCSEAVVKDINCLSNMSVESGELCSESDNEIRKSNKAKEIHHTKHNKTDSTKQETNVECEKSSTTKYKIPKVGQTNKKSEHKLNVPVIKEGEYVTQSKNCTDKVVIADSLKKKNTDKNECNKHDNVSSSHKMKNNKKSDKDDSQNQVSLSSIAIVADDLELSDENSDNVDTHKHVTEKIMKQIKEQSKVTEAKKDVTKNKVMNNANSQQENFADNILEAVHQPNMHEKSKESDSAKKHIRKKRTKSKEGSSKDLVKSTDEVQECEKKTKPKHEKDCKSKESHNKSLISDLFGDTSNSLMTPEDLGLPSYTSVPISDNALDMKIDDIIHDVKPIKPVEQIKIPEKNMKENKIQDILQKSIKEKDKAISGKEHQIYSNDVPLSDMYKNLNSETDTNEPGVVQTVIISKGLQHQYEDSNAALMEKPVNNEPIIANRNATDSNPIPAIASFKKQDLKALATSTPYKALTDVQIGTESAIKDFTSTSLNSSDSAVQAINKSQPSVLDTQDAPDVRIFVKRRRKVVKQTPVT